MSPKVAFIILLFLGIFIGNAQIFSWKNPYLPKDTLQKDSVLISLLSKDYFAKDTLEFISKKNKVFVDERVFVKNERQKFLGDLNTKGAIIRGISFGNNQGSTVQSSMDMQITGKLSNDVSLLASISDHNLPIQADGYTQTLEEFDRIFMQINIKDKNIIRAGHLELFDDKTYFGKYQRRNLGLQFSTHFGKENKTFIDISGGVARSEFHRIRFQGIEGNQGPYRLTGNSGELFITIISGSEQVFIDGILMKRGENLDYTINYNTGEITFTSFRPIFRQNFITISYNYTNRNYARYAFTGNVLHQRKKFRSGITWFWENDNKNNPLSINLSEEDQKILVNAGNNPELMYAPSGVETEFDVNKILYERIIDPSGNYYQYSKDASKTLYQVAFTYFGPNLGDYTLQQTNNNGRVFLYVGPNNGDYRAVRKLPAPQKTQVISYQAECLLNQGKIGVDVSVSQRDTNLFSSKDAEQNWGFATRIFGQKNFIKNKWKGIATAEIMQINKKFHILDRINDVEFSRDFNLPNEFNNRTQNRIIASFQNQWNHNNFLNLRFNLLNEKNFYNGIKNDIEFNFVKNNFQTNGSFSVLKTNGIDQNTDFIKGNILTEKKVSRGTWAIGASTERNIRKLLKNDLFDASSFSWKEVFVQKKIGDTARIKLLAKLYFRDNDSIRNNQLENQNQILGIITESQIIENEKTTLSALLHYRKFQFQYEDSIASQNNDFVIGNLLYHQQLFRNGLRIQAFYELGNGQEAQREFQYLKVTDGQGVYKWTDYNEDGTQQLDEFEIAEYADLAQYIRVYTNSIRYLPSNKNKIQVSIFLNPSVILDTNNTFLKRWNFNLSVNSSNSFLKKEKTLVLNPFEKNEDQILKNQNVLVTTQFNQTEKSGWNGNFRFISNQNLVNANFSNEERNQLSRILNLGYWFHKDFRIDWENNIHQITHNSQLFNTRNFILKNWESKPKATYRFSGMIQAEIFGSYREKKRIDGEEFLKTMELNGTLQLDRKKNSIRASFSFINHDFFGNNFSLVGNQMLDGLKPGKNLVWSLFLQQAINSFISLNINYEGRNTGERTIHLGGVQVKASF